MSRTPESEWLGLGLGYRSNAEARSFLEERADRDGSRHRIGTSVEGRPIEAYEWRLGGETVDSPCLLLLSLVHPMEWIGREIHLALIEDLLDGRIGVAAGTRVVSVVDANPDGTARVESALRSGRPAWVRGNARGIDLNRNFPAGFRTRPQWVDFWPMWRPGPSPLSEPESQAILVARNLARSHGSAGGADRGSGLSISLHSFGRWVFYPPSSTRDITPLAREHERVISRARSDLPGDGYRTRQLGRYAHWFRAHGTEIDFLADEWNEVGEQPDRELAYLVELSWGGFCRWGVRRLLHPFFTFNPPHPEREIERVRPFLHRLIEEGIRGPRTNENSR